MWPRVRPLSFVKTSCTRGINDLAPRLIRALPLDSCHDRTAPASPRLDCLCFWFPRGPHPRESRSPSAAVSSARQTTSPSAHGIAQAVLGRVAKALVWMEKAAHSGHPENSYWLASCRLPAVLEVALKR